MNIFQMIVPEDQERVKRDFKLAMKTANNEGSEYTGLRKDGTRFPIKIFTSPIINNNQVQGLRGIILDITKEKTLQDISDQNMNRFYSFFENIGEACIILKPSDNDESFIIYDINFESEKLSNIKREEVIGDDIENILNILKGSRIIEILKNVNSTGNKEYYSYYAYEDHRVLFWIDTHVFKLSSGELVLVYEDVTESKKIQESLKMNKTKYKTLFDSNPCYMTLIDINGRIVEMNKSLLELIGLKKEKVIGKHFLELNTLCEEDKNIYQNYKELFYNENINKTENIRLRDKEGNIRWVKNYFSKIDFMGEIKLVLVINVDITQQKIYDNQLRAALNEKEVLLKEIHHRVKNNMQIISSLLNLQKSYVDDDEAVNILLESQNRVRSMALVHEKLYSTDNLTAIHIGGYIRNLVDNLFFVYNVNTNNLFYELNVENIVLGMETAIPLGLIINELVSNSFKYAMNTDDRKELFISLNYKNPAYELIVRDNGPGIPSSVLKDCKTLGLILVNNLVEQLEGSINVKNENGTEFCINFKELEYPSRI